jgi:predicted ferric reductase
MDNQLLVTLPWYLSRASAIAAYILTFLIIFLGTGMTTGFIYKYINPVRAWVVHKYLGIAMLVTVIIHPFSLLFDEFINFELADILVPFVSSYKPVVLSLGIIASYFLLIIMLTSLFARLKHPYFWRLVHYLTYLFFILALLHGVFLGTDTQFLAMQIVYWLTGLAFLILVIYRLFYSRAK